MENKFDLLEKLGYSKEYLKLINDNEKEINFPDKDLSRIFIEIQQFDSDLTSLIIEKTERPIINHLIYNEK